MNSGMVGSGSRAAADTRPSGVRKVVRWLVRVAAIALVIAVLAVLVGGLWLRSTLKASLPRLDGDIKVAGLTAPVTLERDALGVPTIRGSSRIDVARATGFVHAQDRFFQMDLLRRGAAGDLAEILGPALLPADRENRVHLFRALAQRVVEQADANEQALLRAYSEGVNAGLASLGARPFEYLALRSMPAPWKPEDSILVVLFMFIVLQSDTPHLEANLGLMHDLLPEPLFEFLAPRGTEWDAPLTGGALESPAVPGPDVLDLRTVKTGGLDPISHEDSASRLEERDLPVALGSNNWAVAGSRAAGGVALLASDMHLGISVPNTWYRISLTWPAETSTSEPHRVTGVTLPGTPALVAGSNGKVAWGFTNSQGDWSDLILIDPDPARPGAYLTPEGSKGFIPQIEQLHVWGGRDEALEVLTTIWGPIVGKDHRGRRRARRWTAHDEAAVDLHLLRLEDARGLDEALDLATRCGLPAQNFVAVDTAGRIGWTLAGAIPRRIGFDGRLPASWADGTRGWNGWLTPAEHPRVVDPPSGFLWTANARVVEGAALAALGDGGYDLGARARQIRDDLSALASPTREDMLRIQLDDRALFLERWRDLLLRTLATPAAQADSRHRDLRQLVENWGGHAATDSVGYRMVRAFRVFLADQVFAALTAPCKQADPEFDFFSGAQYEGPLWKLATERPPNLLSPRYKSWDEQFLAAIDAALDSLLKDGSRLAAHPWGERNTSRFQHPLSRGVPFLARWLDMPRTPLPGDNYMPRVQGPTFGASERIVVSPGHEQEGFFHMPCGQSGHPLSPHYSDGHAAWVRGDPTPFLPGPPVHTLTLSPSP